MKLLNNNNLKEVKEILNIINLEKNNKSIYPHFSIMIPVYNTKPELIERNFKSIITQTSENFSVDITYVNDGSTSTETIKKLNEIETFDNIKVLHHKQNKGVSEARNTALSNLESRDNQYIMWVDSDDELAPNALKRISNELKKQPDLDILRFNYKLKFGDITGNKLESMFNVNKTSIKNGIDAIIDWSGKGILYCTNGAFCIKRNLYDGIDYTIKKEDEDVYAITVMLAKAKKVKAIPNKLYFYYQYGNSISNNESENKIEQKVQDTLFRVNQIETEFQKIEIPVEKQKIILDNLCKIICISDKKSKILRKTDISRFNPIFQKSLKKRIRNDLKKLKDRNDFEIINELVGIL